MHQIALSCYLHVLFAFGSVDIVFCMKGNKQIDMITSQCTVSYR